MYVYDTVIHKDSSAGHTVPLHHMIYICIYIYIEI